MLSVRHARTEAAIADHAAQSAAVAVSETAGERSEHSSREEASHEENIPEARRAHVGTGIAAQECIALHSRPRVAHSVNRSKP